VLTAWVKSRDMVVGKILSQCFSQKYYVPQRNLAFVHFHWNH